MANVLIISTNGFSKVNCNKTYESVFRAFCSRQLVSFFTRPYDKDIDYNYCSSYYSVSESDIIKSILRFSNKCGGIIDSNNKNATIGTESSLIHSYFSKMSRLKQNILLKDILWRTNKWWTKDLLAWLSSTGADIIFFHDPGMISFHRIVNKVSAYLNIPIIYYVTDDYYKYYTQTLTQRIYLKFLIPVCKKTLQQSVKRYCIGTMMAMEYEALFGEKYEILTNCVKCNSQKIETGNQYRIASYFGGLHLDRWKMLSRFAKVFDGEIRVYTSTTIEKEMEHALCLSNVKIMGCLTGDALFSAMQQADILLHIESDDKKYTQRTRLAVSTKIPEYLSMGKLIVGYGDPELASMRLLSDNQAGIVIDSKMLLENARTFLCGKLVGKDIMNIKKNAQKLANVAFNEDIVARNLKKTIEECCNL